MSGHETDPDIVEWLREHPLDWKYATVDDYLNANDNARRMLADIRRRADAATVEDKGRRSSRRTRRWWAGIGGLIAALGAGSLAYALWPSEQVSNPVGLVCYADADLMNSDRAGIEFAFDPTAACGQLWSDGTFGVDGPPPLVACVNSSGLATVLPGEQGLCEELGLPAFEPGLSDETNSAVELNDLIIEEINAQPCASAGEVLGDAEQLLAESGLEGWTSTIGPGWEDAECAKVAVNADTRTLTISGVRPPSPDQ